jgi:RNA polymerase sigma-70 factor (ECF subfamily)
VGEPSIMVRRSDTVPVLRVIRDPSEPPADGVLVERARLGDPRASRLLYDGHAPHVARVLTRILGSVPDVADLLHDVFRAAFEQLPSLAEPSLFRPWITRIAVFQARGFIRKRARWRWLRVMSGEDPLEEPLHVGPSDEISEALRAVYAVFGGMPAEERIPFALRRVDGMALGEVAAACGVSLATIKRRLDRAEARFRMEALRHPSLREWVRDEVEEATK